MVARFGLDADLARVQHLDHPRRPIGNQLLRDRHRRNRHWRPGRPGRVQGDAIAEFRQFCRNRGWTVCWFAATRGLLTLRSGLACRADRRGHGARPDNPGICRERVAGRADGPQSGGQGRHDDGHGSARGVPGRIAEPNRANSRRHGCPGNPFRRWPSRWARSITRSIPRCGPMWPSTRPDPCMASLPGCRFTSPAK